MTIPPNPSFSRSGRSVAGGKNIERVSADVPDDYASRHARLHREAAGWNEITAHFELEEAAKPKKAARVPRDTEPCNLVRFLGIVSGGVAAAVIGAAVLGWAGKEAFDALAGIAASWLGGR